MTLRWLSSLPHTLTSSEFEYTLPPGKVQVYKMNKAREVIEATQKVMGEASQLSPLSFSMYPKVCP